MTRSGYPLAERLAAAALLFALIAAALAVIVPPALQDYWLAESEIETLGVRHRNLVDRQRDLAALRKLRDELRNADRSRYGILVADTLELARAETRSMVQEAATATGAAVARIRAVSTDDPGLASSAISLRIPADGLPEFLLRIANADPLLFVDRIDIRSDVRRRRRQEAAVATTLAVEVVVSAYVAPSEAGSGQ